MRHLNPTDWQHFLAHRDDPDAFGPVFDATRDLVYTICRRLLKREDDALDAFQSTYARLLEGVVNVPPGAEIDHISHLAYMEANRLRMKYRRRTDREVVMDTHYDIRDEGIDARDRATSGEVRQKLERLVEQLPEQCRLPIILHFFDGLSHRQIAAVVGCPAATITSRIKKGIDLLQPMARKAGLGDALAVLGAVAATSALMAPPSSATAAVVLKAAGQLVAQGLPPLAEGSLWGSLMKMKAVILGAGSVAAVVLLVLGLQLQRPGQPPPPAVPTFNAPAMRTGAPQASTGPSAASKSESINHPLAADTSSVNNASGAAGPVEDHYPLIVTWDNGNPVEGARIRSHFGTAAAIDVESNREGAATISRESLGLHGAVEVSHEDAVRPVTIRAGKWQPTVALERGSTVFGTVYTGEGDTTAAGATVSALGSGRSVVTEADGTYTIRGVKPGPLRMAASLAGKRSYRRPGDIPELQSTPGEKLGPIDLRLGAGTLLSVVVFSRDSLAPVPGARVLLQDGRESLTDAEGVAKFDSIVPDIWEVRVLAEGFAQDVLRFQLEEGDDLVVESQLSAGTRLQGRVIDDSGAPIPGARVKARAENGSTWAVTAETDAEGVYTIANLPTGPGTVLVELGKGGFVPATGRVALAEGTVETATFDLNLRRTAGVALRLVDEAGTAVNKGRVVYQEPVSGLIREANVDGNGLCLLSEQASSSEAINFWADVPGFLPTRTELSLKGFTEGEHTVRLRRAPFVTGRVQDEAGIPIEGAEIRLRNAERKPLRWDVYTTDRLGHFTIPDLGEAGSFKASALGYRDQTNVPFAAEGGGIEVTLMRDNLLRGTIIDADTGRGLEKFSLVVTSRDPSVLAAPQGVDIVSANGSFELAGVPEGECEIAVRARGYAPASFAAMVSSDSGRDPPRYTLSRSLCAISGRVMRGEDAPVPGAEVTLLVGRTSVGARELELADRSSWPLSYDRIESIRSDAGGRFAFQDVPLGTTVELLVVAEGFGTRRFRRMESRGADGLGGVVLPIDEECRLVVRGVPPGGSAGSSIRMKTGGYRYTIPPSRNPIVLGGFMPGVYQVFSHGVGGNGGGDSPPETELLELNLTAGSIQEIDLGLGGVVMTP